MTSCYKCRGVPLISLVPSSTVSFENATPFILELMSYLSLENRSLLVENVMLHSRSQLSRPYGRVSHRLEFYCKHLVMVKRGSVICHEGKALWNCFGTHRPVVNHPLIKKKEQITCSEAKEKKSWSKSVIRIAALVLVSVIQVRDVVCSCTYWPVYHKAPELVHVP